MGLQGLGDVHDPWGPKKRGRTGRFALLKHDSAVLCDLKSMFARDDIDLRL